LKVDVILRLPLITAAFVLVGVPLLQEVPFQVVDSIVIVAASETDTEQTPLSTLIRFKVCEVVAAVTVTVAVPPVNVIV
jgi:hypothetical protein